MRWRRNKPGAAAHRLRKADMLLAAGVLLVALVLWLLLRPPARTELVCVVRSGGEVVATVPLGAAGQETLPLAGAAGIRVVLEKEPGRICFRSAGCPDQICVHRGWLTKAGDTAVCLPARVSLTVEAAD